MKHTANKAYSDCADQTPSAAFKRLLQTYDIAIKAGIEQDSGRAEHVISFLESTINEKLNPELTLSLKAIYQDCRHQVTNKQWAEYTESMERLKALWISYERSLEQNHS